MESRKLRPGEKGGVWGKQGFGGYPGVKHTAKQIVEYMPLCKVYVEPFAGLGRTAEYISSDTMVLNDRSAHALKLLRKKFPSATVEDRDFMDTIKEYDGNDTFFFFDPPWKTSVYDENNLTFCDRQDVEYYQQLFITCQVLMGNWIIASSVDSKTGDMMRAAQKQFDWYLQEVESKRKVILGRKARTLLLSNKPFEKHRPFTVGMDGFL